MNIGELEKGFKELLSEFNESNGCTVCSFEPELEVIELSFGQAIVSFKGITIKTLIP